MGFGRYLAAGAVLATVGAVGAYAQYRNTETPVYEAQVSEGAYEVRDYAPMIVAEVTYTGSRRQASSASFRRLAAYIFGQDRPQGGEDIAMTAPVLTERVDQNEKIAMTAPVLQEQVQSDTWRMRFIMPAKYAMETLPEPPSDITLTPVPARRMAAVRFNGYARSDVLAKMEGRLMAWVEQQGLTPVGNVEYASYDAPMVPGPMRRNEVLVEVTAE